MCFGLNFHHLYLLLLLLARSPALVPGEGPADMLLPGIIPAR